jgi:hypothetical protein
MRYLTFTLLALHILTGTLAVIVGLVALLTRKPLNPQTGRTHRRSGNVFLISMIAVISTATLLTLISFNPYFAGLTVAATIAVFSGYRVLGRKRPDLSPQHRARLLDWIVTLMVLAVGALLIVLGVSGRISKNLPVVYSLGIGSVLYAVYDLYRFARPLGFPFSPNL